MRFRWLAILLLPVFMAGCASWCKKESRFYSVKEKEILISSTQAIGFDYGYDDNMELDYIFSNSYSINNIKKNEKQFDDAIGKFDRTVVIIFYEKIFRLKTVTRYKMLEYKEDEDWQEYTYIKNYLLPSLEKYCDLLEERLLLIDKLYKEKIADRKKAIDNEVKKEME